MFRDSLFSCSLFSCSLFSCSTYRRIALAATLALSLASLALANDKGPPKASPKPQPKAKATERLKLETIKKPSHRQIIKGKFKLDKILVERGGKRQLWFAGRTAHGAPLSLVLVSRYTHPNLRQGDSYQLAAEVGETKQDYYLLNKALVYFSGGGTTIPVWIMADHASLSLDVEKYLKMHAPSSDYLVL